ncbi:MAG: PAS domain S-box protein [Methylococcaceae bacterium]|nr:PAS domain S-box protein [Methylococcaceae bacterium]
MKLLIIDDNADQCALTIAALRSKFNDVDIVTVSTAISCEEVLNQADFELVICEFNLAWTDGLALFKIIHSRFACIPVIMLTDSGNEEIAVAAIKMGFADYLNKQNRHLLAESVERCLVESASNNECPNSVGNIQLCEKWDLAISRLTSDFAYSMRIAGGGNPVFEWCSSPLKKLIPNTNKSILNATEPLSIFGLPVHPDDIPIVKKRYANLLAGNEDTSQYRIISAQGDIRWFNDHALPIRDWQTGQVVRIYGAIQDITNRLLTEEKLYLMQHAMDSSNNGIIITDLADSDYAIIYTNDAFVRMTGYTREKILGRNPRFLQKTDREQPDIDELRMALKNNHDGYAVLRNYRQDGSLFWNEINISPIRNRQGKITHYVGIQNDVTGRIEVETLQSKSEAKLRAILNNIADAIIISDDHGVIELLNPAAETTFGFAAGELTGKNVRELLPESDRLLIDLGLTQLSDQTAVAIQLSNDINGLRKDASTFPIDFVLNKIDIDQRKLIISTIHDISESKLSEQLLRNFSSHLEAATEQEKTRIAREIHDQLGSILTALKMDLSWLKKQLPEHLTESHLKISTMKQHINDAMQTVREIATALRPSILDHLGLIAAIDWQLDKFKQQTGIDCTLLTSQNTIEVDEQPATAIFRIVQEALTNISQHAHATEVNVNIHTLDADLLLTITDNGCGMNQSQMHKLGRYGILGMHERVRHFGGTLTIDSAPDAGTRIKVRMPQHLRNSKNS